MAGAIFGLIAGIIWAGIVMFVANVCVPWAFDHNNETISEAIKKTFGKS